MGAAHTHQAICLVVVLTGVLQLAQATRRQGEDKKKKLLTVMLTLASFSTTR